MGSCLLLNQDEEKIDSIEYIDNNENTLEIPVINYKRSLYDDFSILTDTTITLISKISNKKINKKEEPFKKYVMNRNKFAAHFDIGQKDITIGSNYIDISDMKKCLDSVFNLDRELIPKGFTIDYVPYDELFYYFKNKEKYESIIEHSDLIEFFSTSHLRNLIEGSLSLKTNVPSVITKDNFVSIIQDIIIQLNILNSEREDSLIQWWTPETNEKFFLKSIKERRVFMDGYFSADYDFLIDKESNKTTNEFYSKLVAEMGKNSLTNSFENLFND